MENISKLLETVASLNEELGIDLLGYKIKDCLNRKWYMVEGGGDASMRLAGGTYSRK